MEGNVGVEIVQTLKLDFGIRTIQPTTGGGLSEIQIILETKSSNIFMG